MTDEEQAYFKEVWARLAAIPQPETIAVPRWIAEALRHYLEAEEASRDITIGMASTGKADA